MADSKILKVRGIAVYPALLRPDTKFDELGQYKCDLKIDPKSPAGAKALEAIRAAYKEATGKPHPKSPDSSNRNAVYYMEVDKDTEEETGMVILKVRVKNKLNRKSKELWDRRPAQFDAKGKPIKPKNVWGGSVLIVNIELYIWQNRDGAKGLSLQPQAVQIIELVTGQGRERTATDYGFGEEDGYSEEDGDEHGFDDETDGEDSDEVSSTEDDEDGADY